MMLYQTSIFIYNFEKLEKIVSLECGTKKKLIKWYGLSIYIMTKNTINSLTITLCFFVSTTYNLLRVIFNI